MIIQKKIDLMKLSKFLIIVFFAIFSFLTLHCEQWISYYDSDEITCILPTQSCIWLGTERGLVQYDRDTYIVRHYLKRNSQLPSDKILSLAEDKSGNVWIGTSNGLVKYDGINWTSFFPSMDCMVSDEILNIFVDNKNNIWIGTTSGMATSSSGIFSKLYINYAMDKVNKIYVDDKGDIFFLVRNTYSELYQYKYQDKQVIKLTSNSNSNYYDFTFDNNKNLWLIKGGSSSEISLKKFDGSNWETINLVDNLSLYNCSITADKKNNLWFSHYFGIVKYNSSNNVWTKYLDNTTSTKRMVSTRNISIDNDESILIASKELKDIDYNNPEYQLKISNWYYKKHSELSIFNEQSELITLYNGNGNTDLTSNEIRNITLDYFGRVIFGGSVINTFNKGNWKTYKYLKDNKNKDVMIPGFNKNSVAVSKDNLFYFYSSDKIYSTDFIIANPVYEFNQYTSRGIIHMEFENDNLWVISSENSGRQDVSFFSNHNLTKMDSILGFDNEVIYAMTIDNLQRKWFITEHYNNGYTLTCFDNQVVKKFNKTLGLPKVLASNSIIADNDNQIIIGTYTGDLIIFDGVKTEVYNSLNSSLPDSRISDIKIDKFNNIWIAYGNYYNSNGVGGLIKWDGKVVKHYTSMNSGLLDNNINCLAIDDNNNIWIGTNYGINLLNEDGIVNVGDSIINLSENDNNNFSLYPNPSNENVYIDINNYVNQWINLSLYNLKGQIIKSVFDGYNQQGKYQIDLQNLAVGSYILVLSTITEKKEKLIIRK